MSRMSNKVYNRFYYLASISLVMAIIFGLMAFFTASQNLSITIAIIFTVLSLLSGAVVLTLREYENKIETLESELEEIKKQLIDR